MKRIITILCILASAISSFGQEKPFYKYVHEARERRSAYGLQPKDSSKLKTMLPKEERLALMEEIHNSQWPYGRTPLADDSSRHISIYGSRDPMNEGEILVYFLFPNFPDDRADRIYVVMDKAACLQFVESLHQCDRKLKEWRKIARRNNIELYSGDIGIEFPPFDIYWQKRRPAYGKSTYFPCFMWAGIDNWFKPVGHISKDGNGTLEVNFLLPDFTMEEDYPVRIFIYSTTREYIFKFLDYETLKKAYWEVNRPAESYDHLFK